MTNVVRLDGRVAIEREARKWLIRMDADKRLSGAEREALREWVGRSALHRNELARLSRFWSQANILTELIAGLECDRTGCGTHRRASWMRAILVVGAVFAAVVLVYFGLQPSGEVKALTYETVVGHQRTVLLADGSSLELNTDSRIQVVYSRHLRLIRLLKGEVLFSVTPDAHRVFEVRVADSVVRAVGTAFVVHLDGRKVDVTVAKGMVDVSGITDTLDNSGRTRAGATPLTSPLGRVKAGEVARLDSGGGHMQVRRLAEAELQRRMAWQDGFLVFSGEPLSEVVAHLNRYSTTRLEIGDPELASIEIGGRFRVGDVDGVLELLGKTFGIRGRRIDGRSVRLESAGAD